MTTNRKILIGMLAMTTLLGVSAVASATGDVSVGGSAVASGGASVDASPRLDDLHQTLTDTTGKVDGVLDSSLNVAGSATGALDAQTQHAGADGELGANQDKGSAQAQGGFMAKLGAELSSLFHL